MSRYHIGAAQVGLWVAGSLLLSGCLFSRHQEPTALYPADSLSREIARALVVDSLVHVGQADSTTTTGRYLNSVQFGPTGVLYATDLQHATVLALSDAGTVAGTLQDTTLAYPYLVGARDSAVAVFSAGTQAIYLIRKGKLIDTLSVPAFTSDQALSAFAAVDDDQAYFKYVNPPGTYLIDLEDAAAQQITLAGPGWRHRGVVRLWGDRLLSFSAYRPVVDVLGADGRVDTLALVGFDSPMLARSRAYVLGEEEQAPLLISSAKALGNRLYVLNLRPGIIRVDVYDTNGRLLHILEYARQALLPYTPLDLAVQEEPDGTIHLAVVSVETAFQVITLEYVSRLDRFTWKPNR